MRGIAGVPEAVAAGRVGVVGAVYDLDTGRVDLLPDSSRRPNTPTQAR
jgi:carbonic anhydrase